MTAHADAISPARAEAEAEPSCDGSKCSLLINPFGFARSNLRDAERPDLRGCTAFELNIISHYTQFATVRAGAPCN